MHIDGAARMREAPAAAGNHTLAEGLTLVRASTLKLVRLQLAIERHDRLAALEAVDGLVELDRRLQTCLEPISNSDGQGLRRGVEADRFALNREKLTLAAEVLRRPDADVGDTGAVQQTASLEPDDMMIDVPAQERRHSRRLLAMAAIALVCVAGAVAAAGLTGLPNAAAWLAGAAGAL
jgi:hypothetical protein